MSDRLQPNALRAKYVDPTKVRRRVCLGFEPLRGDTRGEPCLGIEPATSQPQGAEYRRNHAHLRGLFEVTEYLGSPDERRVNH